MTFVSEQSLDWQTAAQLTAAACEHAITQGLKICVQVVDRHGNPLAMQRINHTPMHCTEIAADKAYTAAGFSFATHEWQQRLQQKPQLLDGLSKRPRLVVFGGGLPIFHGGTLLGAIGVSGATELQDIECAQAGLDALRCNSDEP